MPRKYLVAIIRAWWFPLVMGFIVGTVASTWSIVESIKAVDSVVCGQPADSATAVIPELGED